MLENGQPVIQIVNKVIPLQHQLLMAVLIVQLQTVLHKHVRVEIALVTFYL